MVPLLNFPPVCATLPANADCVVEKQGAVKQAASVTIALLCQPHVHTEVCLDTASA